jgi:rSAM/selenodomain-associated transferase 1
MDYQYPNAVIQVFCKAPIAGHVKTRLIPELTAIQAAEVHQNLTRQTLELVTSSQLCPIQLCCTPRLSHPFFIEICQTYSLITSLQSSGDLGNRMYQSLNSCLGTFKHALLIGCDCVSLTQKDLANALKALTTDHDIVLAPAEDGGYCLIGMNSPQENIFTDICWGTSKVLKQTRSKIRTSGLNCLELKTQWDVDNYADYLRFLRIEP